ncbi:MAG: adenylate/guanylate cyclase domain-containing protein [Magnetococcales bacterium]|nr:adenylate/guanylate cyclase domain-containing protein [Magnetococcales bacterium]
MTTLELAAKIEQAVRMANAPESLSEPLLDAILQRDPVDRVRLNPYTLAEELAVETTVMLDIFVHGARNGLFEWGWDLICPMCGFVTQASAESIDKTPEEAFHCALCDITAPSVLDDTVEVSFTPTPDLIAPLEDRFVDQRTYLSYYASQGSPYLDRIIHMIEKMGVGGARLEPGAYATLSFMPKAGATYRLSCLDSHDALTFHGAEDATAVERLTVSQSDRGFLDKEQLPDRLPTSRIELKLINRSQSTLFNQLFEVPGCSEESDTDTDSAPATEPMTARMQAFRPRVTGKSLLNNQTFRDYYGIQKLDPNLQLKVRDLTLLFTDLKGSTELYDRTGDIEAYRLVRDHFVVLKQVVRNHAGAVVKTMGDAIMATFSSPEDGVAAAVDILTGMRDYSNAIKPHELGMKLGLHRGPALTVSAGDQLDFFGQTVNIAARVQGLASAGEICLTEMVNQSADVRSYLERYPFDVSQEEVFLKGVSERNTIHRYTMHIE